jgi:hypothetical protein
MHNSLLSVFSLFGDGLQRFPVMHHSVIHCDRKAPSLLVSAHILVGEQRFALANNGSPLRTGSPLRRENR